MPVRQVREHVIPESRDLPNENTTRVAAYALLVDTGNILLCRISAQLPDIAGQWTLPGGGIDFGEDPVDAMVREVREETGLVARPGRLAGVNSIQPSAAFHGIRIVYHADVIGGTLTFEEDGTTDRCEWIPLATADNYPLLGLASYGVRLVQQTHTS